MTKPSTQTPIAIVGLGSLLPASRNVAEAWRNIVTGADLMTEVPDGHWRIEDYYDADPKAPDKTYANRGGFLPEVDFDPMGFGIPPSIMPATDTSQLLALMVAERCLEDATGGDLAGLDRERISTLLGVTGSQELLGTMNSRLQRPIWLKAMREAGLPEDEAQDICERISSHYVPWQESSFPGLLGNVVAGRIANRFDLRGTNTVTDAACASSLAAMRMGVNELELGHADMVLSGGVDTMNDIFMYMCFSKTPALSATGDCRPFSDSADGTMLGEGLVMFAMMRLEDAEAQGRQVYAVIKGLGSSSDGRAKSVYAPLAEGQARAVRRAYEAAGYGPETVELVEAHGTGTKAGDAAEFAGLGLVFNGTREDRQWCALGSIKSQIGHTKSAAGAAGLLKAVLALHQKVLPPTAKVARPNPKLKLEESPFYLSTKARPWIRNADHPRRAGVSAFGFGGSNFHITVEEYDGPATRPAVITEAPAELWLFSGASGAEVANAANAAAATCTGAEGDFTFRAAQSRHDFDASQPARLCVIAANADGLSQQLAGATPSLQVNKSVSTPKGLRFEFDGDAGQVAFLFPGQGSQYIGMGADVAMGLDVARAVWDRAASHAFEGKGVHQLAFPPPPFTDEGRTAQTTALTATEWAQPAIGVSSLALLAVMTKLGVQPAAVAGHSYGEITALHAAGVISALDHLKVSRKRGELMRDAAATPGSMTVVTADVDEVRNLLSKWDIGVVLANHNSPTQAVISGPTAAVAEAEIRLKAEGMRFKRLNVATAFHSEVVSGSCEPFAAFLAETDVNAPTVPVYGNSEAAPYAADADTIRATLSGQIAKPVRFVEQVEAMYAAGSRTFVEVGPGSVLTGLVGRILGDRPHVAVALDRKGKNGLTSLQQGLGQLATLGVTMDFANLEGAMGAAPLAKKKAKMTVAINGSNYGKPYPAPDAITPPANPARAPDVRVEKVVETVVEKVVEYVEVPVEVYVEVPGTAATPAAAAATTQPVAGASDNWIAAYQELQRQTADAHASYQRATAETHGAFLRAAEASITTLGALLTGAPVAAVAAPVAPARAVSPAPLAVPVVASTPVAAPVVASVAAAVVSAPVVAPVVSAPAVTIAKPAPTKPVARQPAAPKSVGAPAAAPAPKTSSASTVDLEALMMEVVAEKTGYPVEMLGMEMELEADLGVDSIKRVEILSSTRERAPGLGEIDPTELASLNTLAEIVTHLRGKMPAGGAPAAAAPVAPSGAASSAGAGVDLEALMMEVVAEKTGYPAEMLGMEMELEADLGVDSIKRVEILSSMREQAPELGEIDPSALASLNTLAEIVSHLRATMPAVSAVAPVAPIAPVVPAAAAAAAVANGVDLEALMMEVVAEKTGYPAEMLGMEMELEADLGVDSIKRVEILSSMREQAPELGEIDPSALASLNTLAEIVSHLRSTMPAAAAPAPEKKAAPSPAATPAPAVLTPASSGVDLEALMMVVVAEKTGYPAEMLGMEMELEADLGVDSIKRVEILSAMREHAPELGEIDPSALASLNTLAEIVSHLSSTMPQTTTAATTPAPTSVGVDLEALMMEVVAEKTGYPAEMLGLEMELEADLGVDSIKRVEILSAMRERAPGMAEVDPSELAALNTLAEIVSHLRGKDSGDFAGSGRSSSDDDAEGDHCISTVELAAAAGVNRFAVRAFPSSRPGLATAGLHAARRLVVSPADSLAEALVTRLCAAGVQAEAHDVVPEDADAVVYLGGLQDVADRDDALAVNVDAFGVVRGLAGRFSTNGGLLVTVQDTGGDFALSGSAPLRAWTAGVAALARTAACEWPKAVVRSLDVCMADLDDDALSRRIADELLLGGSSPEIGINAAGERVAIKSVVTTHEGAAVGLDSSSVVVASGGARGVTAASLIALAKQTSATMVLLGRTPLAEESGATTGVPAGAALKKAVMMEALANKEKVTPAIIGRRASAISRSREVRGNISAMEAAGSSVCYLAVDVMDAAALSAALDKVRADFGPISAIVHGAGVLADKLLADKTDEQFARVFDTKAKGLIALLDATRDDPLRAICLFSSVAARAGNLGQSDYAMANEVLNAVACAERAARPEAAVSAIGWGPWAGGMVTPELKAHFERQGVALVPLHVGAAIFVEEITSRAPDSTLVVGSSADASSLRAGETRAVETEVWIHVATHPEIDDHRIEGVAVVPVALATELLLRGAADFAGEPIRELRDLKVLRGIKLPGFDATGTNSGDWLRVLASASSDAAMGINVELRGADGALHYRALAMIGDPAPIAPIAAPVGLARWGLRSNIYDGHLLFHGPRFHAISDIQGAGAIGLIATALSADALGWASNGLFTDPALTDAAMQAALLWAEVAVGGATLPMGYQTLELTRSSPITGDVQVVVLGGKTSSTGATCDVLLRQDEETVVAWRGVQLVMRPGEPRRGVKGATA